MGELKPRTRKGRPKELEDTTAVSIVFELKDLEVIDNLKDKWSTSRRGVITRLIQTTTKKEVELYTEITELKDLVREKDRRLTDLEMELMHFKSKESSIGELTDFEQELLDAEVEWARAAFARFRHTGASVDNPEVYAMERLRLLNGRLSGVRLSFEDYVSRVLDAAKEVLNDGL